MYGRMFFTEPMVTCIALYASFVYGLLFLMLEVFPIVFREQRQYGLVVSALPFLGLFVGVVFAILINIANQPLYIRAMERNKGRAVPEARLPPMIIGGVLFSTGLFWFGWTAAPKYPWASPVVAAGKSHIVCSKFSSSTDIDARIHRCWIHHRLPTISQLPRGHIRALRSECNGCKHIPTFLASIWTSFGSEANVPQHGNWACIKCVGRDLLLGFASTVHFHEVRLEAEEDVQIRSCRGRLGEFERRGFNFV
jgi:hypothetical protein